MDNFRQYIKEAHLKDDDGYEFELTEDKLKMYFYIFNDKYFNNKLKSIDLNLVNFSNANRDSIGFTNTTLDFEHEKLMCNSININVDRIRTFKGFRDTLVHEMLHYYIYSNYQPDSSLWKKVKTKYNTKLKNHTLTDIDKMDIMSILKIDEESAHNDNIWKTMIAKLKHDFNELNNLDRYNNSDDIPLDTDYIDNFIKNNTVFLCKINNNLTVYVYENNSENYKNIISLLKNGQTTDECFCGEWYKLKIANTPAKFEFFIIKTNLYKNKVLSDNIIIDTAESLKCFEKEKIGIITKKIKESIENDDWNGISININLY